MATESATQIVFPFDNSYARLPARFFARLAPTPVAAPRLLKLNEGLARDLGLEPAALKSPEGVQILAGNQLAPGSAPLAQAYAGHQFGGFVPQLGDGRAILLGEVIDRWGRRRDIQLKGSGPTPFSRRGDGRAAIGPVLREYIVSEAMHALGIPTTRSLAAVATGEPVYRETVLPGAVLTRVAASHIRVGTFQYFAAREDVEGARLLADYVIARHDPELAEAPAPYLALLDAVVGRQAALIAQWMLIGFIHGVMNTDNCAISGETIDYGPCAFMDTFHPHTVYSSIDAMGRYAYSNQPRIGLWNLTRFAETLLPLLGETEEAAVGEAKRVLETYSARFEAAWLAGMRRKLGLTQEREGDAALAMRFLELLAAQEGDFTLAFRRLADVVEGPDRENRWKALLKDGAAADAWLASWRERLGMEDVDPAARAAAMRRVNPLYIPRNHLVEEALAAAQNHDDLGPFEQLVEVLSRPFDEQPGAERYAMPPRPEEVVTRTFCGT